MKTNSELQKEVQDAIKWEPLLHAAEIGVIVKDGVVTLTGTVDNYTKKLQAEKAAKSVTGVRAIVADIEVKFANSGTITDAGIAKEVLDSLRLNLLVPDRKILVEVDNGWVTLQGDVSWNYQRKAAVRAVNDIAGVKGVFNHIKIRSELNDELEQKDIEAALARNWAIDADDIKVRVSGRTVTLTGTVSSWYQKEKAESIAWNTPGIWEVDNKLEVEYDYSLID